MAKYSKDYINSLVGTITSMVAERLQDYDEPVGTTLIQRAEDVVANVEDMRGLKHEEFCVLTLDNENNLINKHIISKGTLTESLVHPREVFFKVINDRAVGVVFVHNHPSGSIIPSEMDLQLTKRLKDCCELLGIYLYDHIIVTKDNYNSILHNCMEWLEMEGR